MTSLPARGAWIEISGRFLFAAKKSSLPARGAWIEIAGFIYSLGFEVVAPRKGSVD